MRELQEKLTQQHQQTNTLALMEQRSQTMLFSSFHSGTSDEVTERATATRSVSISRPSDLK